MRTANASTTVDQDVVAILQDLLRIDTTNRGPGDAVGEAEAVAHVRAALESVGFSPTVLARDDAPHRQNLVLRVPGTDPDLPGLLVHGHLDVVPAEPQDWSVDPFAAVERDGYVVGRGATDMKDMCASMLSVLLHWGSTGTRPRRDVVMAFVADEETDGAYGAEWLVDEHPDLFEGLEAAIGESGGVIEAHTGRDGAVVHLARVSAGERGTMHVRLTARGASGHGSRPTARTALGDLLDALHRIEHHRWPVHLSDVVRAQLTGVADALGVEVSLDDEAGVEAAVAALGDAADVMPFTIRASTTPTVVHAGSKVNVIPGNAVAEVDVRCPPGYQDELQRLLPEVVGPHVTIEPIATAPPVEAPIDSPWFTAMGDALRSVDPDVVVVPGCLGGGTDAKAFSRAGLVCYGFAPLTLDPEGRLARGIHGVDERVPVASLRGGRVVLGHFLEHV